MPKAEVFFCSVDQIPVELQGICRNADPMEQDDNEWFSMWGGAIDCIMAIHITMLQPKINWSSELCVPMSIINSSVWLHSQIIYMSIFQHDAFPSLMITIIFVILQPHYQQHGRAASSLHVYIDWIDGFPPLPSFWSSCLSACYLYMYALASTVED